MATYHFVRWFSEIGKGDIPLVGGKGANLGEMTRHGVAVPPGFCVTAEAYREFVSSAGIGDRIREIIGSINYDDADDLNCKCGDIRRLFLETPIPEAIRSDIETAYRELCRRASVDNMRVAVRSSATAEDLPDASFAGQQDTYLHIRGAEHVTNHVRRCWSSLWTGRATYYRQKQGYNHFDVSLSAVVQKMVNSGKSGVMFTANPITNDRNQIMINSSWGLGEAVVAGIVTPDEFTIDKTSREVVDRHISDKNLMIIERPDDLGTMEVAVMDYLGADKIAVPSICESEVLTLADAGMKIEKLYGVPQDIEWAFDKDTSELYILQSRPVTTLKGGEPAVNTQEHEAPKQELKMLVRGLAASPGLAAGKVVLVKDLNEIGRINTGDIMVTGMTNPDMVPAMRKAAAVVTDEGGRTCHAAIVSRELGIPCVVGSKTATGVLKDGMIVTVDATRGVVFEGNLIVEEKKTTEHADASAATILSENLVHQLAPVTGTKIYMNLGEPSIIGKYQALPFDGIGLMRTEFIFTNMVGIHPMYLVKTGQGKLLVDKMSEGITAVAQAIYPRPIVVRMSDFRTNEFRGLKGGEDVEPEENNPMIGWRGVSRYISPEYEAGFRLECQAIRKVREEYGLINVWVMLPFVRTVWELERVKAILTSEGLVRSGSFKLWIMAEVPSVVFAADEFAQMVDGFSIGSNDLTQLVMGVDRDSGVLNSMGYFDERDISVKRAISTLIRAAHGHGITCSICGQGPSLYPDFTEFLIREGIDSVSVNPDTVAYTRRLVASMEQKIILGKIRGE
jgi:pyruvate,water dikinase